MKNLVLKVVFALIVVSGSTVAADEPIEVARGSKPSCPQQPQLAVDEKGAIHLVFGVANAIKYCRSTDGGKSFSPIVELANSLQLSLGMRRGPRVAATSNAVCVTFVGGKEGKGRDGDLLAMRSTDGGATWTGPVAVNSVIGSAREGLHGMAAGPNGQLCCVWLDLRNKRTEVMASTSPDGGVTWEKNSLVYQSPSGNVCECCHPSVCFDVKGSVYVLWRNSLDGSRDMYWTKSNDGCESFDEAAKLGLDTWQLDACPMDGGGIAISDDRVAATAWRRENTVYLSTTAQTAERRLGNGEQPWIACTPDGPYVIWLEKRGGEAKLHRPNSPEAEVVAQHAIDPVIVASRIGNGPVIAAWESVTGDRHSIQILVIRSAK